MLEIKKHKSSTIIYSYVQEVTRPRLSTNEFVFVAYSWCELVFMLSLSYPAFDLCIIFIWKIARLKHYHLFESIVLSVQKKEYDVTFLTGSEDKPISQYIYLRLTNNRRPYRVYFVDEAVQGGQSRWNWFLFLKSSTTFIYRQEL